MRTKAFACLLGVSLFLTALSAYGQDQQVPKVAPRPANTLVMLPDGSTVHVELAKTEAERNFGLMERTSLPQGRGMLFIHEQPGHYGYWMYDCKIGLDIIWMDQNHRIVEMSPNTPPCKGKSNTCPSYGGHEASVYVLELPVGSIKAHQLAVGQTVNFNVE
ncbi:MAG: DUF192 domain-containing protein [Silvibacterium sp.]|nr:DUF192 domain-containing protein [Silvibacterium sp.]MBV8438404.1 DUF192 domain-containing protein [Silvibacterium sp.]